MCLLLLALQPDSQHPLIVAANRDEFHDRPTAPAHWWPEGILAGRDRQAGGTWLGVSRDGRFAALTNFRNPIDNDPARASRGELVVQALTSRQSPAAQLAYLTRQGQRYNGFNLLFGSAGGLYAYNNQDHSTLTLSPGLYGLSNHLLETPWPKVCRGKHLLRDYLAATRIPCPEPLFELLADRQAPGDAELPHTGVGLESERLLAPMFIVSPHYGTRSSSVLIVDQGGRLRFAERSYDARGRAVGTREFRF